MMTAFIVCVVLFVAFVALGVAADEVEVCGPGALVSGLLAFFTFVVVLTSPQKQTLERFPASVIVVDGGKTFLLRCGNVVDTSHDVRLTGKTTVDKVWTHSYNRFGTEVDHTMTYDYE